MTEDCWRRWHSGNKSEWLWGALCQERSYRFPKVMLFTISLGGKIDTIIELPRMSHLCGLCAQALVVLLRFGGGRNDVGDKQKVAVGQS
jgi:hypothetical protein